MTPPDRCFQGQGLAVFCVLHTKAVKSGQKNNKEGMFRKGFEPFKP
ncbi:MAG: hypothetical protein RLY97_1577 [Pseudomonadota bacterium]